DETHPHAGHAPSAAHPRTVNETRSPRDSTRSTTTPARCGHNLSKIEGSHSRRASQTPPSPLPKIRDRTLRLTPFQLLDHDPQFVDIGQAAAVLGPTSPRSGVPKKQRRGA